MRNRALLGAVIGVAAALAACTNTTDPVLSDEVCVESHTEMMMIMQYIPTGKGGGTFVPQFVPHDECDRSFILFTPNPDYHPRN